MITGQFFKQNLVQLTDEPQPLTHTRPQTRLQGFFFHVSITPAWTCNDA